MRKTAHTARWAALAACGLALAARAYRLAAPSLWTDEAISVHLALDSLPALLADRVNSLHPPLYFVLLKGWVAWTGSGEFAVRYLSVIGGVLTVALAWRAARRMFDPLTGMAAAVAAAVLPALLVYSQEARTYAFLPPVYLFLLERAWALRTGPPWRTRDWAGLALAEIASLYLHAFAGIMIAAFNVYVILWLTQTTDRRPGRAAWKAWAASQAAAGLTCVPWVLSVALFSRSVAGKITDHYPGSVSPSWGGYARLIWLFFNTGLVDAYWTDACGALGLAGLLALALALAFDRRRRALGLAAGLAGLPLAAGYAMWLWRPLAHPRYLLFAAGPSVIVAGRCVIWLMQDAYERGPILRGLSRAAGAALAGLMLATWLPGLNTIYFDERLARDDVRGLAARLSPGSGVQDAFIVPEGDYSLAYYYRGPASVVTARVQRGQPDAAQLERELLGKSRAVLVTYPDRRTLDPLEGVPFLLELNGRLVSRQSYNHMALNEYALAETWTPPRLETVSELFAPPDLPAVLELTGMFVQRQATTDNAITVALRWRMLRPVSYPLRASVVIWDPMGWRLSGHDVFVRDELGRTTNMWRPGTEVTNYYVAPVPLGVAPREYELTVKVYDATPGEHLRHIDTGYEDLSLGLVTLAPGTDFSSDPYESRRGLTLQPGPGELASGLALEGYRVSSTQPQPGDVVNVDLRWRSTRGSLPAYRPRVRLTQAGRVLAEASGDVLGSVFPPERWAANFVLIEQRQLTYPLVDGATQLELNLEGQTITLADLSCDTRSIRAIAPGEQPRFGGYAQLAGYKLESPSPCSGLPAGQAGEQNSSALRVTLYWQATGPAPLDYTVFTHVLDAHGQLVAQHDGPPAGGARPAYTWKPGDLIADVHDLACRRPSACGGPFTLAVGWYDPATLQHVKTEQGREQVVLTDDVYIECAP